MNLTTENIRVIKNVLVSAKTAGMLAIVISDNMVKAINPSFKAAFFSDVNLDFGDIILAIPNVAELHKRISIYDDASISFDLKDYDVDGITKKLVRKITIKGKSSKIEYRCADPRTIKHPKTNSDTELGQFSITKADIKLLVKGCKTMNAENLVLQIKDTNEIHVEALDVNNDKFELDLDCEFEPFDDTISIVNSYDVSNKGVFLDVLDGLSASNDTVTVKFMSSNQLSIFDKTVKTLILPTI